jgi:AraC-like DNA-binding protein
VVAEIRGRGLRPQVLDARAAIGHLAVRHYGLSLSAVARHLHVSRQSIARGLERAQGAMARHGCTFADFLAD